MNFLLLRGQRHSFFSPVCVLFYCNHILITGLLLLLLAAGCSKQSRPPHQPIIISEGLVDRVEVLLNGENPATGQVSLIKGEFFTIEASYSRSSGPLEPDSRIVMLLVNDDQSVVPDGIQYELLLGFLNQERVKSKVYTWECRLLNGTVGKKSRVMVNPGLYELRLCWQRDVKTVKEKQLAFDSPTLFQTPFYSATIEVRDNPE